MGLIDQVTPSEVGPVVRELLERLPDLPHFRLLARAEAIFPARLEYGGVLMRALSIDDAVRETAILRCAGWAGCAYVQIQHEEQGRLAGLGPEQIAAAVTGDSSALEDETLEATVTFVDAMLDRAGAGNEAVGQAVAVLGQRGVIEVGLVVERYLGLSLLLATLGVEPVDPQELIDIRPH